MSLSVCGSVGLWGSLWVSECVFVGEALSVSEHVYVCVCGSVYLFWIWNTIQM